MLQILRSAVPAAAILLVGILVPAEAQVTQQEIARQLLSPDRAEQFMALREIEIIDPRDVGQPLREALIRALERENAADRQQVEETPAGAVEPRHEEDHEFRAALAGIVIRLEDPQTIPALAAVLGHGLMAARALAAFGEEAVPAVLGVVRSPQSHSRLVNGGLIALRFMVEGAGIRPLGAASLEQIRAAAEYHLNRRQSGIGANLRWAIDLAVVLDDPELRAIVESIARDPNEIIRRGITDPDLVDLTQQRAVERLAGVPPLPRWR